MHRPKISKTNVNLHLLILQLMDRIVDVDENVLTSGTYVMTDTEIIAQVTQSQYDTSDVTEDNN